MSVLFLPLLNHVKACLVHERKSKQLTTEKKNNQRGIPNSYILFCSPHYGTYATSFAFL